MIDWIEGKVCRKEPTKVVIENGGLAVSVIIPLSTYEVVGNVGDKVKIFTHLIFKNEKFELFGFKTIEERGFFTDLLLVEGIGPYTALRIISSISFDEFKFAIFRGDVDTISSIKGISEKRANKLILELKEKYKKEEIPEGIESNAIKALISLGVDAKKARLLVHQVKATTVEDFIKQALKKL